MRTFGVRALPRILLLVVADPKETFSATELERFRLRPFPLRESLLLENAVRNLFRAFTLFLAFTSHPTVGVALFGSNVSDRLSSSREELPVSL